MGKQSVKSPLKGHSPRQELEEGLRSRLYLLVRVITETFQNRAGNTDLLCRQLRVAINVAVVLQLDVVVN